MSKGGVVAGSGNAGTCARIAALEAGASVPMLAKAKEPLAGGNKKYTAGAMRIAHDGARDLMPLLKDLRDPRLERADLGAGAAERFRADLLGFDGGRPLSREQGASSMAAFRRCGGSPGTGSGSSRSTPARASGMTGDMCSGAV